MASVHPALEKNIHVKLSEIIADGIDVHRCAAASALGRIALPGSGGILQKALLDEDEDVRTDTMTAISQLADPQTAEAVMESFLGDPCPEVKLAAIKTLVKIRHQPIIPYLTKLVVSRDEEIVWDDDAFYEGGWDDWLDVQFACIEALGMLGISDAIPAILEALNDDMGQDVSPIAIVALAKMGDAGFVALDELMKSGDVRMRRRICSELNPGQSKQADAILDKCLDDEEADVRQIAVAKLIESSPEDPRLVSFFEDLNADIRTNVVESIGVKYQGSIMARLNDKEPKVRRAAFRVIAAHPENFEKEGFSEIVAKAIGGNPDVAGDATVAWAALIGEPSAASLGEALENDKQPVAFRLGLIEALALLQNAGFDYLAKAAGDENRQVRINALTAIGSLASQTPWPNNAGETLLAALNGELVEPPAEEVAGQDTDDAKDVVSSDDVVEENTGESDADATTQNAEDGELDTADGPANLAAVSTLDQLINKGLRTEAAPDPKQQPEEIELSEEDERFIELSKQRRMRKKKISLDVKVAPHQDVRRFSARLFSDLDQEGVVEALVAALGVDDNELKLAVLDSLGCLGEKIGALDGSALNSVLKEVDGGDSAIGTLAIRCLGWISDDTVDIELMDLLDDDDVHVRQEAIRALGIRTKQSQEMRDALSAALKDDYSGVRITAARAIATLNDANSLNELVTLSLGYDGMHRSDVVAMLKSIAPREAGELYLKVLEDESSKRVWRVAIEALGELFANPGDSAEKMAA